MNTARPAIVLVHGTGHGAWCWRRVVPVLTSRNVVVRTVELLSVGAEPDVAVRLENDAAAVRAVMDEIGGRCCCADILMAVW